MGGAERFGEFHRGVAADGMTDDGDRLGITAVIVDRLRGDAAPDQMRIDRGGDAGAGDAFCQLVHAPVDQADQATE